jgi:general secretion pathway protein M
MNGLVERAADAWSQRSSREQVMLAVMGLLLIVVLGWFGVVQPLGRAVDASRDKAAEASARLAGIEAIGRAGGPGLTAAASQPLGAIVDATAQAAAVTIDRRREEPDGRLTVWLTSVEPGVMMGWLTSLAQAHGVAVTDVTASRLDGGLLEAQITLEQPAS